MTEQVAPGGRETKEFLVTPIVYMIFIRDGQILLLERGRGTYDGYHSLPAGHIDEGYTAVQTVVKESQEELAVEVDPSSVEFVHLTHIKDPVGQRFIISMKVGDWNGEPINNEPHKHKSLGWFPLDQLPDDMISHARSAVENILNGVTFEERGWSDELTQV